MSRIESPGGLRQREPRARDKGHLGRVAKLPCLACLIRRGAIVRPVHVCHIRCGFPGEPGWRSVGAAEKPSDFRTWPGCPSCHLYASDAQHGMSERVFWDRLGVYPPDFCSALVEAFAAGKSGLGVVLDFAERAPDARV